MSSETQRSTQGSTYNGVRAEPSERSLWILAFAIREAIFSLPQGVTREEWCAWLKTLYANVVFAVSQVGQTQPRPRIPFVVNSLYAFYARYKQGDPVANLLDILEVRSDQRKSRVIYDDLEAVTENGAVQFFIPDWRTSLIARWNSTRQEQGMPLVALDRTEYDGRLPLQAAIPAKDAQVGTKHGRSSMEEGTVRPTCANKAATFDPSQWTNVARDEESKVGSEVLDLPKSREPTESESERSVSVAREDKGKGKEIDVREPPLKRSRLGNRTTGDESPAAVQEAALSDTSSEDEEESGDGSERDACGADGAEDEERERVVGRESEQGSRDEDSEEEHEKQVDPASWGQVAKHRRLGELQQAIVPCASCAAGGNPCFVQPDVAHRCVRCEVKKVYCSIAPRLNGTSIPKSYAALLAKRLLAFNIVRFQNREGLYLRHGSPEGYTVASTLPDKVNWHGRTDRDITAMKKRGIAFGNEKLNNKRNPWNMEQWYGAPYSRANFLHKLYESDPENAELQAVLLPLDAWMPEDMEEVLDNYYSELDRITKKKNWSGDDFFVQGIDYETQEEGSKFRVTIPWAGEETSPQVGRKRKDKKMKGLKSRAIIDDEADNQGEAGPSESGRPKPRMKKKEFKSKEIIEEEPEDDGAPEASEAQRPQPRMKERKGKQVEIVVPVSRDAAKPLSNASIMVIDSEDEEAPEVPMPIDIFDKGDQRPAGKRSPNVVAAMKSKTGSQPSRVVGKSLPVRTAMHY
ncbi:hypothetical protein QCA50_014930 [Cerrena zonata]|uniref:Uncharacterized protein n=1 Tax=Cerrena zonata TaxID=2478898 RepID=A0AAW0FPB3_9APHY